MKAKQNDLGLYEFSIDIKGSGDTLKKMKGIVDTGSTFCACNHKVITTLRVRPIDHRLVSTLDGKKERRLIYEAEIGFDGKNRKTEVARLSTLPDGISFILGNSILDHCNYSKNNQHMDVTWK